MAKLKELETLLLAELDAERLFNPGAADEQIADYESKVGLQRPHAL